MIQQFYNENTREYFIKNDPARQFLFRGCKKFASYCLGTHFVRFHLPAWQIRFQNKLPPVLSGLKSKECHSNWINNGSILCGIFLNKYTCSRAVCQKFAVAAVPSKVYNRTKLLRVSITDHRLFDFYCNEQALEIVPSFDSVSTVLKTAITVLPDSCYDLLTH